MISGLLAGIRDAGLRFLTGLGGCVEAICVLLHDLDVFWVSGEMEVEVTVKSSRRAVECCANALIRSAVTR